MHERRNVLDVGNLDQRVRWRLEQDPADLGVGRGQVGKEDLGLGRVKMVYSEPSGRLQEGQETVRAAVQIVACVDQAG